MRPILICGLVVALLLAAGCAAGSDKFDTDRAGFWAGLWHGLICPFAFIISLFNDNVLIYEAGNSGHLYDLGFVLGLAILFGGCGGSGGQWCRGKSTKEKEWDDIGEKVEEKVKRELSDWAEK